MMFLIKTPNGNKFINMDELGKSLLQTFDKFLNEKIEMNFDEISDSEYNAIMRYLKEKYFHEV